MVDSPKSIEETLRDLMDKKGVDVQKLSDLTDVPKRFIEAILGGDFSKLPAKPYIRGYLFKIANVLDIDNGELWQTYRFSTETPSSGDRDLLPGNRFALKKISPSKVLIFVALILIIIFFVIRFDQIVGSPNIEVSAPEVVTEDIATITGQADPQDRVTINGELIYINEDGTFSKDVRLESGINTFRIVASRRLGGETEIVEQIIYNEPEEEVSEEEPPVEGTEEVEDIDNTNNTQENGQN